jgi:hypothetical protein
MASVATALNNLKQENPQYYKLYKLAVWLNRQSSDFLSIEEDESKLLDLIVDLQKVHDPDSFVNLIVDYDIFDRNKQFDSYSPTLGEIAWGVASKYLVNN